MEGRSHQSVAYVHHGFDLQAEDGQLGAQAVDVNMKAFGVERLVAAPNGFPKVQLRVLAGRYRSRFGLNYRSCGSYLVATAPGSDFTVVLESALDALPPMQKGSPLRR